MDTIQLVKELREITGCGFADCKSAIIQASGNIDNAVKILREMGKANACKKVSRSVSEGIVIASIDSDYMYTLHIGCETDFVARGDSMNELANAILSILYVNPNLSFEDFINKSEIKALLDNAIMKTGENIVIKAIKVLPILQDEVVFHYVHNKISDNVGQIIAAVKIKCHDAKQKMSSLMESGKKLAMHIAASSPICLHRDHVAKDIIEDQRSVFMEQIKDSGKTKDVMDKIIDGKMSKFYESIVLLEQSLIMDDKMKIDQFLSSIGTDMNSKVEIVDFVLVKVGN